MRRLPRLAALLLSLAACQDPPPDPCAGYPLACLAVTVESGPANTYQLLVSVAEFGTTPPLTPKTVPDQPLIFPLRFALRFSEFDHNYDGHVIVEISALDSRNDVIAQAREMVAIDNKDKKPLSVRLGAPFDMRVIPDLRPAPDLRGPDLSVPADLIGPAPDGGVGD